MIRAFESIANYDFGTWMIGIMRSFISGGAAAFVSGLTVMGVDSEHFNLGSGRGHIGDLMVPMFVVMGLYRMAEFLQLHGAPDQLQKALDKATKESDKAVSQASKASDALADVQSKMPETK